MSVWKQIDRDVRIAIGFAVAAGAAVETVLSAIAPLLPGLNVPARAVAAVSAATAVIAALLAFAARHGLTAARLPRTRGGRVLGRRPAVRPARLRLFTGYLKTALPPAPETVAVPAVSGWGMDGNDQYGDCTIAACAHLIAATDAEVAERAPVPTAAQTVAEYKTLTGCKNPGDAHDTGLVISTLLKRWAAPGLFSGDTIAGYAPVAATGVDMIRQAVAAYGACYVGVNLPQSAEDQFDAGQPWTYVGDNPIGGHCVVIVGYDSTWLYAVTWGAVVKISAEWWAHYGEEAWAVIPEAFVDAGKGPEVDLAVLKADIDSLRSVPVPVPPPVLSWWARLWDWLFG